MTEPLTLSLPSDFLDLVARRVIEMLDERDQATKPGPWLNVTEAAEHLCCPKSRLYALVSARRIPHHKDGSRLLFDRHELDDWVRAGGATRP